MNTAAPQPAAPAASTLAAARRLIWLLVVPALALLAVLSTLQYQERIADAERDLLRRADERAQELDAIARPAMAHVHDLRELLQTHWNDPPDAGPALREALQPRVDAQGAPDGWSLDGAGELARQRFGHVWWAPADGRMPDAVWLRRAEAFVDVARLAHRRAPNFEASWFSAAEVNTTFGTPWVDTSRMLAASGAPSLRALDARRVAQRARAERDLAADPGDTVFWGLPMRSPRTQELVMTHSARVIADGHYRGEVGVALRLEELQRAAQRWQDVQAGSRVWVTDRRFNVLADASQPLAASPPAASQAGAPPSPSSVAAASAAAPPSPLPADEALLLPLAERLPSGLSRADLDATLFTLDRVQRTDGWVLAAAVRIGSPWVYVQAVPQQALRAMVLPTLLPNALLGLALLGIFVAGQWLFARGFVDPALRVLAYLRRLSTDPEAPPPQLGPRWRGWVDAVTMTFAQQRELQRRERAHEAFKSAMIDHAPTAIITADAQGTIVDFNPAAEAMFGLQRQQAIGAQLAETVLPERHRARHRAEMARMRQGETIRGFDTALEMVGRRADGTEFPMEVMGFQIRQEGEVFYTGFVTDLSARQEAARQIERQRDALRQTEKLSAMGTLLAGVAHELNNPLAIVMGRASLLEEKAVDGSLASDARRIREAAERCGRIVRTFLNMARHKPAERGPVQINDIVRAAADMLGYTLRSHGITLDLALADPLPEVQADGDQLGQVVLNLIVNAQQALSAQEGARRIGIATGVEAPRPGRQTRLWLRVTDSGPGVAAETRDKIFEPFFTTKGAGLGTGLGLSVSRTIVREHGGDLILEARDSGASFRMSLPISGQAGPASSAAPLAPAPGEAHARLLVVDDEPEIADLIRTVLEGAGFDVATAESGAVALELLGEARFDAIVSDMRMPDIDGLGLWRQVREQWPSLARRMLFVTGDTLSPQARQMLDEAGCPSLDKPFANSDLVGAVFAVLER